MTETLQLNGLVFEVRRSDRRKTLGLTVDRGGELVAHVPLEISVEELTPWINRKLLWVYRKLALKEDGAPKVHAPEYVSGEAFCYLGRRFRLKVVPTQKLPLQFDGTRFILRRDARPAEVHFRRWYLETGTDWLRERVERLSQHTTQKPEKIEVRDLGFRWGSCGKAGVVYFNWKALQLPVRLVDYIIMHELVHLVEGHHGPKFWQALGRAMPDWQKRKDALADKAKEYLVFGLPPGRAVIRKLEFSKQYVLPANPYDLALEFGLERMFLELNSRGQAGKITHIIVEKRGEKEDNQLELAFRRICAGANALNQRLPFELVMIPKASNSTGLQIADLVARSVGIKVLRPMQPNRAYDIVAKKFRRSSAGETKGWGLKVFP